MEYVTLSQISHVGTSVLPDAPDPALADDGVVVAFDSDTSTFTTVTLLFGFDVAVCADLVVDFRAYGLVCTVPVLVVNVVAFDNVGSLKICGLFIGFVVVSIR